LDYLKEAVSNLHGTKLEESLNNPTAIHESLKDINFAEDLFNSVHSANKNQPIEVRDNIFQTAYIASKELENLHKSITATDAKIDSTIATPSIVSKQNLPHLDLIKHKINLAALTSDLKAVDTAISKSSEPEVVSRLSKYKEYLTTSIQNLDIELTTKAQHQNVDVSTLGSTVDMSLRKEYSKRALADFQAQHLESDLANLTSPVDNVTKAEFTKNITDATSKAATAETTKKKAEATYTDSTKADELAAELNTEPEKPLTQTEAKFADLTKMSDAEIKDLAEKHGIPVEDLLAHKAAHAPLPPVAKAIAPVSEHEFDDEGPTEAPIEEEDEFDRAISNLNNAKTQDFNVTNGNPNINIETPANLDETGSTLAEERPTELTIANALAWKSTNNTETSEDEKVDPANIELTRFLENPNIDLTQYTLELSIDFDRLHDYKKYSTMLAYLTSGGDKNIHNFPEIGKLPIKIQFKTAKGEFVNNSLGDPHTVFIHDSDFTNFAKKEQVAVMLSSEIEGMKSQVVQSYFSNPNVKLTSKVLDKTDGTINSDITEDNKFVQHNLSTTLNIPAKSIKLAMGGLSKQYVDHNKELDQDLMRLSSSTPGALYAIVKSAANHLMPLRLWVSNITSAESDVVWEIYSALSNDQKLFTELIPADMISRINKSSDVRVNAMPLDLQNTTYRELLNFLVFEGRSVTNKGIYLDKAGNLHLGKGITISKAELPNAKDEVSDYLAKVKRQISISRINDPAYKKYIIDNEIVTTNAIGDDGNVFIQPVIAFAGLVEPSSKSVTETTAATPTPVITALNKPSTQPSTSVKEGVSELFDSNPELANQVYEALGFKTKPDVILPIGTSGSGKSTFIKSLPQKDLVVIEPDAMRVEFTGDINNKSKDKEIYEEAAKRAVKAIKQGKQVIFDTTNLTKDKRLPFIEAIKKALPNANIQYKLMELNPELAKQRIKAQIERGEHRANVPDSTIDRHTESYKQMLEDIKSEPISNFEITPQQKQQSLQLYSQYIDTIFPDSKVKDILYHMTSYDGKKGIEQKGRFLKPGEKGYQKRDYATTGGIYFTDNNSYDKDTEMYGSPVTGAYGSAYVSAILNIKNPLIDLTKSFGDISKTELKDNDGFVGANESKEIGVLEPEQIHILGSKQDIEGFKSFVTQPSTTDTEDFSQAEYEAAMDEQRAELEALTKHGASGVSQFIHDNFGGIRRADYVRHMGSGMASPAHSKLFSTKALPIDTMAQEMSEDSGMTIEESDIIDYVNDRVNSPRKFLKTKGIPKSTPKSKISGESSELIDSLFGDSNENITFGGLPESILRFYNSLSRKEQKTLGNIDKLILEYQELGLEASEEDYIESLKCKL
jgi:predicted kinase